MRPMVEQLLPSMKKLNVIDRATPTRSVRASQIMEFAAKVDVRTTESDHSLSQPRDILERLHEYSLATDAFSRRLSYMDRSIKRTSNVGELITNVFGTITGNKRSISTYTTDAVIYMSRKRLVLPRDMEEEKVRASAVARLDERPCCGNQASSTPPSHAGAGQGSAGSGDRGVDHCGGREGADHECERGARCERGRGRSRDGRRFAVGGGMGATA